MVETSRPIDLSVAGDRTVEGRSNVETGPSIDHEGRPRVLKSLFGRTSAVTLALSLLPLAGISGFAYYQAETRMTRDVVAYFLEQVAFDTADTLDSFLRERRVDLDTWVHIPLLAQVLSDARPELVDSTRELFDSFCEVKGVYDIVALFDADGFLRAANQFDPERQML